MQIFEKKHCMPIDKKNDDNNGFKQFKKLL